MERDFDCNITLAPDMKRPLPSDDFMQEANLIVCKRLAPPDDHLQEAGPNNNNWGDEGVTRVTGVTSGEGTEG